MSNIIVREKKKLKDREDICAKIESMASMNAAKLSNVPQSGDIANAENARSIILLIYKLM